MNPCECGCGELVREGSSFIRGHNSRVKNPMEDPKTRDKLSKTRRGLSLPGRGFTCLFCGKGFRDCSRRRKFCSRACSNRYHSEDPEIAGKISRARIGERETRICIGCRESFQVRPKKVQKYCSKKCQDKYHTPWNKGKPRSKETRKKISQTLEGNIPWNKGYGEYMKGENNPNWYGGISTEPYGEEFNEELKREVKEIHGFKCYICRMTEKKSLEEIGRVLIIHHIDFDKRNNRIENLIPLCYRCHGKVTLKREIIEVKH